MHVLASNVHGTERIYIQVRYMSVIYMYTDLNRALTQHHAVCCQALEQGWGRPLRTQWIDANRGYRLLQQLH